MHRRLQIFGHNRHEWFVSLPLGLLSLIFWLQNTSPPRLVFHEPLYQSRNTAAAGLAIAAALGVVALLCAINAVRDDTRHEEVAPLALLWVVFLCGMLLLTMLDLVHWWADMPSILRPF